MQVLIIDDELLGREKIQEILKIYGACDLAVSGQEALEKIKSAFKAGTPYDLITLDIDMPGMDGIAVLNKIRDLEKELEIPVESQTKIIMITYIDDKEKCLSAISHKCNDYIIKPINEEKITERLKYLELI